MSLKNWILHKMNGIATRADLPRSPVLRAAPPTRPRSSVATRAATPAAAAIALRRRRRRISGRTRR